MGVIACRSRHPQPLARGIHPLQHEQDSARVASSWACKQALPIPYHQKRGNKEAKACDIVIERRTDLGDCAAAEQPHKGQPNYLLFNFNGRDYEYYQQCTHLPNYIVQSLLKQNRKDWQKVRELLPYDYKIVRVPKTTIYSQPNELTRMYLLKDDVVEVTEEKGEWLQIKYYIEKKNKDTGRTIEGWIKKSDVE